MVPIQTALLLKNINPFNASLVKFIKRIGLEEDLHKEKGLKPCTKNC